jgi:hypothetical protein
MAILSNVAHGCRIGFRLLALAGLCWWSAGALSLPGQQAANPQVADYQVKAAFLLNFTKFVQWPASSFEDAQSPLAICILGNDPFNGTLDQFVSGESVGGRKVVVRRLRSAPAPKNCQVLYISPSERNAAHVVSGLGPGVLTVSDGAGFLRDGGMIAFVVDNRHVRFDINQKAAAQAGLGLSARLLNVARRVEK